VFYGIIISLYYFDNKQHHTPHIHAHFQEYEAVLDIYDAEVIDGNFPKNKLRLVQAWIELHRDEIIANWELAVNGDEVYKIEPLK
jgi:hypothetical protein